MRGGTHLWCAAIVVVTLTASAMVVPPSASAVPSATYSPHLPISISGNAAFTAANGVTGGNGSVENPFVFEGWEIAGWNAISIESTTAAFVIRSVHLNASGNSGVFMRDVQNGRVENSTIEGYGYPVNLQSVGNVTVAENLVSGGIFVVGAWDSVNVTISRNRFIPVTYNGVVANRSENLVIENNTFEGPAFRGIALTSFDSATIRDNEITGFPGGTNVAAIEAETGSQLIVSGNRATGPWAQTVTLMNVDRATLMANELRGNADSLTTQAVSNLTLEGNVLVGGGWSLSGTEAPHFGSHHVGTNNSVNGKPVVYYANCDNLDVNGVEAGEMVVGNCRNSRFTNLTITSSPLAFTAGFLDNVEISNNSLALNRVGIRIANSTRVTLLRNVISDSTQFGMTLHSSSNLTLLENRITGGSGTSAFLGVNYTTLIGNTFSDATWGLSVNADHLTVYHNNLLNPSQVSGRLGPGNRWDDGYPSGGNYWPSWVYQGMDQCSGLNQDVCPDPDGIGDTPLVRMGFLTDRYPLMNAYSPVNVPPDAVFAVTPPVGNGATVFAVDASASTDPDGSSTALEFRWDWEDDGGWDLNWSHTRIANHKYGASGNYSLTLEVRDLRGGISRTSHLVQVDADPPATVARLYGTAGSHGWFVSPVTVTLQAVDGFGGSVETTQQLDGGGWTIYHGPIQVSGDGRHSLNFRSEDDRANLEPFHTVPILIDSSPPRLFADALAPVQRSSTVEVSWSSDDTMSGIDHFEVGWDGADATGVGNATNVSLRLSGGTHRVVIRAVDCAGNAAETNVTFQVDIPTPEGPGLLGNLTYPLILGGATIAAAIALLLRRSRRNRRA